MNSGNFQVAHAFIDWQVIDTVLLDMDGTLLDLHFDNYFWQHYLPAAYAVKEGLSLEHAKQQLVARFNAVHGTLNWYCLDYWCRELGLDILGLKREIRHLVAVRPGVWDFLRFLRGAGKRCVLITNAHPGSLDLKMEMTGMAPCLNRLVSTHDLGAPKEEQAFWQELSRVEPFNPRRTLFIDDTPQILAAGQKFGIAYLWSISQPDSQVEPNPSSVYASVQSFHPLEISPPG